MFPIVLYIIIVYNTSGINLNSDYKHFSKNNGGIMGPPKKLYIFHRSLSQIINKDNDPNNHIETK